MNRIVEIAKKTVKNKAVLYVFSRYATYFVQFVNSLFIAIYLGPYYLGIWGFIQLVVQYMAQINLGIPHAVNIISSIHKQDEQYVRRILGNGISMTAILSVATAAFFIANHLAGLDVGSKYHFSTYAPLVLLIATLAYFNSLFINIFRIYGKIFAIALNQTLFPLLVFCILPFFRNDNLLWALVVAECVAVFVSLIIFVIQTPIPIAFCFDKSLIESIRKKGWHLFVYNTSFYLILLTTRSFISGNYNVKEFGFFTFSFSLANTILLLLNSVSFLIFPKLINRFASSDNEKIWVILQQVRALYISTSHFMIHIVILVFPLFIMLFPKYQSTLTSFNLTALTVVLCANSFGYSGLLMAKGKEKLLGRIAFCALSINIAVSYVISVHLSAPYSHVILATMAAYCFFVYAVGAYGRRQLGLPSTFLSTVNDIFPVRLLIPFAVSLFISLYTSGNYLFFIPLIIYSLANYKNLFEVKTAVRRILDNPSSINI